MELEPLVPLVRQLLLELRVGLAHVLAAGLIRREEGTQVIFECLFVRLRKGVGEALEEVTRSLLILPSLFLNDLLSLEFLL